MIHEGVVHLLKRSGIIGISGNRGETANRGVAGNVHFISNGLPKGSLIKEILSHQVQQNVPKRSQISAKVVKPLLPLTVMVYITISKLNSCAQVLPISEVYFTQGVHLETTTARRSYKFNRCKIYHCSF